MTACRTLYRPILAWPPRALFDLSGVAAAAAQSLGLIFPVDSRSLCHSKLLGWVNLVISYALQLPEVSRNRPNVRISNVGGQIDRRTAMDAAALRKEA